MSKSEKPTVSRGRRTRLRASLLITLSLVVCVAAWNMEEVAAPRVADGHAIKQQVENLRALARLYGYVRYFHPSDEAAAIEWEPFLFHAIGRVKDAATLEELQASLEALFVPIAPTVRIRAAGSPASASPMPLPDSAGGLALVAWQHLGLGLGVVPMYRSVRLNRPAEGAFESPSLASARQIVDARPYRGMTLRLEAAARLAGPGRASLSLDILDDRGSPTFAREVLVTSREWQPYTIEGTIPVNAASFVVTLFRLGPAAASYDDVRLFIRADDDGPWASVTMANATFEDGTPGTLPDGWVPEVFWQRDQLRVVANEDAHQGSQYLTIAQPLTTRIAEPLFDATPQPGEVVERPLGRGLVATIPLALYSREGRTLPTVDSAYVAALLAELADRAPAGLTAVDEALRLTCVIITWNVMQHFYPYFDRVDVDWDAVLTGALDRAASDADADDLLRTLQWMLAQLGDGHARVEHDIANGLAGLAFRPGVVENRVVVVEAPSDACVARGDVVVSVDGVAAAQVLGEGEAYMSGSPQYRRRRALSVFGEGERGSRARVVLERSARTVTCEVVRGAAPPDTDARPAEAITELREGVFYIDPARAPISTILARMQELATADAVIIDFRGYPAGNYRPLIQHLAADTIYSADFKVPRILRPDRIDPVGFDVDRWTLPPLEPHVRGRVVFLTDARAMSYAESLMGIVEHYRLGEIVGKPTGGVNGNQNVLFLPGGYAVYFTGMRVDKHDGSPLHNVGVLPTIPAERTIEGVRAGRDEILERALQWLGGSQ